MRCLSYSGHWINNYLTQGKQITRIRNSREYKWINLIQKKQLYLTNLQIGNGNSPTYNQIINLSRQLWASAISMNLSVTQRVLSAFRSLLATCSSNLYLKRNSSWPIILLIFAYQQFLTMASHPICLTMIVPSTTYHVFNCFPVLTPP